MNIPLLPKGVGPLTSEQKQTLNSIISTLSPDQASWLCNIPADGYTSEENTRNIEKSAEPASRKVEMVTVLFGSQTGNCERIANELAESLKRAGVKAKLQDMGNYKTQNLKQEINLCMIVSTYGEGDPPGTAMDLHEFIFGRHAPSMEGISFAVLALGDTSHEHFCQAGKDFDQRFAELGGNRLLDRVDCDVDYEDQAEAWISQITQLFLHKPLISIETHKSTPLATAPLATKGKAPSGFTLVDTDIHHSLASPLDLLPYLSRYDQQRLKTFGSGGSVDLYAYNGGRAGRRVDMVDEGPFLEPGSSVDKVIHSHLDHSGFDIGILTGQSVYSASSIADTDYAASLCRAFNDWTIEHWLSRDTRFRFCMAIGTQDPAAAAKEIDRIGPHPQICGILMPGGAPRPFGQRFYHPIYEACCRHGLTPSVHFFSEGGGVNPAPSPAGYPGSYAESRASRFTIYLAHLASLIYEGIFELFPEMKFAMLECGFSWVPGTLWRMDSDWKALRHQVPWVKKLPSEYVKEHVRFNSQPVDEPPSRRDVQQLIEWMHGDRTLMFGSDFPHWDYDDPKQTLNELEASVRQRVMADNAVEAFSLRPLEVRK